ncbi:hypothetical protein GCM10009787_60730 [Streptomyces bangladeshensis]|uniref:N-acetyltransferase domain-containing protein n=1 Tax=Streptomyces bangladeshensis TaxID=295352 RepID=A0ABP5NSE8_9ACTN
MEISAKGRLEVRITPADVGKRVSVRRLGEPGGESEKFTDTVGVLTSWDGGVLMITRRDGERVRIPQSALVAGKVVPAAPARRRGPSASYPELARIAARAWRPVESERLGEWELRAAVQTGPRPALPGGATVGRRAGFTRRANSVLPLGDPGLPLDAALAAVRRWYGERGLPAYVQTATGAEGTQELLCAELERRGWVREVTAELWTGALAPVADRAEGAGVVLSRTADEAWLARYQRKGVSEVALRVLGSGPSVWFASVPGAGDDEPPAAIGRCVVDGRWAGFAAVEVDPARRRQGLATEVMAALARRALEEGASAAWLQVETDNEPGRALYRNLGFAPHHAYHHYRAPEENGDRGTDTETGTADRTAPGGGAADDRTAPEGGAPGNPTTPEDGATDDRTAPEGHAAGDASTPEDGTTDNRTAPESDPAADASTPEDGTTDNRTAPESDPTGDASTPKDGTTDDRTAPESGAPGNPTTPESEPGNRTPAGNTPGDPSAPNGVPGGRISAGSGPGGRSAPEGGPGGRVPAGYAPGDRRPAGSTPGGPRPAGSTPGGPRPAAGPAGSRHPAPDEATGRETDAEAGDRSAPQGEPGDHGRA